MTESNKRIIQFGAIFVICAVLILIFLMGRKPIIEVAPHADFKAQDSLMAALEQEAAALKSELEQDSANVDLIIQLANQYFDLNKFNEAIEYYEKALALQPNNPLVLADCGVMYYKIGDSDKALAYLDKAIDLQPDLAQAYFNKGLILMAAKNDADAAITVWRKYLEIAPESEDARFLAEQIKAIESGRQ
jgi:tetratricopeptide (TPR) repeat protein